MPVAIAFIRGINVGGKHPLPMARLRGLCEGLGWNDVATHIQSGNLVFQCPARSIAGAARALEAAIEKDRGFRPGVVVRTLAELRGVMAANPFADSLDPSRLLVMFLSSTPAAGARAAVSALKPDPERVVLSGREVYLSYPNGVGNSKFPFSLVERAVKVPGTCRNWNTISKVLAMAEELDQAA